MLPRRGTLGGRMSAPGRSCSGPGQGIGAGFLAEAVIRLSFEDRQRQREQCPRLREQHGQSSGWEAAGAFEALKEGQPAGEGSRGSDGAQQLHPGPCSLHGALRLHPRASQSHPKKVETADPIGPTTPKTPIYREGACALPTPSPGPSASLALTYNLYRIPGP